MKKKKDFKIIENFKLFNELIYQKERDVQIVRMDAAHYKDLGIRGTYLFICDSELKKYFSQYIDVI